MYLLSNYWIDCINNGEIKKIFLRGSYFVKAENRQVDMYSVDHTIHGDEQNNS
jgi:hypothetical protein